MRTMLRGVAARAPSLRYSGSDASSMSFSARVKSPRARARVNPVSLRPILARKPAGKFTCRVFTKNDYLMKLEQN